MEQWLDGIKEGVSNGSVRLCSERTSCGAYLCDGEKPKESNQTVQISPVSAYINAELQRDPGFLTRPVGISQTQDVNISRASMTPLMEGTEPGEGADDMSPVVEASNTTSGGEDTPRAMTTSPDEASGTSLFSEAVVENVSRGDVPIHPADETTSASDVQGESDLRIDAQQ